MTEESSRSAYWRRLILITGHRRSGTTWLNAVLGHAKEAAYMRYEALMVKRHPLSPAAELVQQWRRLERWYVGWEQDDQPNRQQYSAALKTHLEWLVDHYFGGPVDTLLIKDPYCGRLPFLLQAIQPDDVLYVQRHPLGIVNSYDKGNLYEQWSLARDWNWFLRDLKILMPQIALHAAEYKHPVERVALMAHVSNQLQATFLKEEHHRVVNYELLGTQPESEFANLWSWLDWQWDEDVWENIKPIVKPEPKAVVETFFSVTKVSEDRASGWRRELAPHLLNRVKRRFDQIGADYPLPGDGLPAHTSEERAAARRIYRQRRIAYLRQWGISSVIRSL